MKQYKILDSIWFSNNFIGIVAVDADGFGWKCYIGTAYSGHQGTDEQKIARDGMPTGQGVALGAFPNLDPDKYLP